MSNTLFSPRFASPAQVGAQQGIINSFTMPKPHVAEFADLVIQMQGEIGHGPLYHLLSKLSKRSIPSPSYDYIIRKPWIAQPTLLDPIYPIPAGTTFTIKVDNTFGIQEGDLLSTSLFGNVMRVMEDPSSKDTFVVMFIAVDNVHKIPANTALLLAGRASEQGSLRPYGFSHSSASMTVRTQIFRHGYGVTGTARAMVASKCDMSGVIGDIEATSKKDAIARHIRAIEQWLLFGQQGDIVQVNGQPLTTGSGIIEMTMVNAPQNIIHMLCPDGINGVDIARVFDEMTATWTGNTSGAQLPMFCDRTAQNTLSMIPKEPNGIYINSGTPYTNTFGTRVRDFTTPNASFVMMPLHTLEMARTQGVAIVLNPAYNFLGTLNGRDSQFSGYNENGMRSNDNGVDQVGGDFLTEIAYICTNPAANFVVTGLTNPETVNGAGCITLCNDSAEEAPDMSTGLFAVQGCGTSIYYGSGKSRGDSKVVYSLPASNAVSGHPHMMGKTIVRSGFAEIRGMKYIRHAAKQMAQSAVSTPFISQIENPEQFIAPSLTSSVAVPQSVTPSNAVLNTGFQGVE